MFLKTRKAGLRQQQQIEDSFRLRKPKRKRAINEEKQIIFNDMTSISSEENVILNHYVSIIKS